MNTATIILLAITLNIAALALTLAIATHIRLNSIIKRGCVREGTEAHMQLYAALMGGISPMGTREKPPAKSKLLELISEDSFLQQFNGNEIHCIMDGLKVNKYLEKNKFDQRNLNIRGAVQLLIDKGIENGDLHSNSSIATKFNEIYQRANE